MENLRKEYDWYIQNQDELLKKYEGFYLVINYKDVADFFQTFGEAYDYGVEKFGLGNFLIQHCVRGSEAYSRIISPRVQIV